VYCICSSMCCVLLVLLHFLEFSQHPQQMSEQHSCRESPVVPAHSHTCSWRCSCGSAAVQATCHPGSNWCQRLGGLCPLVMGNVAATDLVVQLLLVYSWKEQGGCV
jgi:hypothetical protein